MATKRILVSLIVFLFTINIFTNIEIYNHAKAEMLYVGGNSEGNYSTIQNAINNSSVGDIIYVYNTIYYENIEITKTITLIGENKKMTIINGKNSDNAITIQASNVNITGFTIQNSNYSGILIKNSWNCKVFRNVIDNNSIGIKVISSKNLIISNNTISNNSAFGINITNAKIPSNVSKYNTIFHNNFIDNKNHVFDSGISNNWSYDKEGNFYYDYNGIDRNKDGIGDNKYNIPGGENKDDFPLMMQYIGKIRIKEFYVDDESLYKMLIIGMVVAILFLIPIGYLWYRKTKHLK